ncbi:Ger(x)C family spore germination protein [Mesobacillus jeotgali]|jgi:spore germination protein KC|uniref:Ger(X)C family spore germination protein n=1 Tax=Mesobacillus jeotgali TaxID=129985 RepID=A0ABY9VEI6_9BACI|nr:Ger(x)C family spore germination protein [Mesobacillus jeotgali]WNF22332.1 Ger(x)C family spore germination protein [Mesobacillus jeotgali]
MEQYKNLIKISIMVIIILSLTGCWDKKELDQKAYVIGIGLDTHEKEGKITVTYLIANPEVGSQQSGGGTPESPEEVISLVADDFISSRNTANTVISKEISYDLLSVIIVSEELARKPDFIRVIYSAAKDREIKRNTDLLITKESAETFILNNKPLLETRPHKFFEFMIGRGKETGMIPNTDLNDFFKVAESDADLFLGIYATTERGRDKDITSDDDFMAGEVQFGGKTNDAQFIGSAVFKEGKMIGKITGEETRISSLLDNTWKLEDFKTTFKDPFDERYRISARFSKQRKNRHTFKQRHGKAIIDINVPVYVEILSDPSMVNFAKNKDKIAELKKSMTKTMEEHLSQYIKYTQEEFKGDTFHLSVPIRREFLTLQEFRDFDWMKSYPNAEINVSVDIRFGEFGRQTRLPSLQEVRD